MKSQGLHAPASPTRRLTRRERRAVEIEQAHRKPARTARLSMSNLVGGVVTVLAVVAILTYAVLRTHAAATSTSGGLTDPTALTASGNLLQVGQAAPDFTLKDVNGTSYTLASQRGHPVLLEFFAVWCPVCQGEALTMARLTHEFVPKGVRVWSVLANPYGMNYDLSGQTDLTLATRQDLSWFARNFVVKHPQLIDPQFATVNAYGVNAYPGLYVINKQGIVTYASMGHRSYATLAGQLNRALAPAAK